MIWRGWDEENTAQLLKMAADGFSAGEAAKVLGCTRSAAIGKARRLGHVFGGDEAATPEAIAARVKTRAQQTARAALTRWGPKPKPIKRQPEPHVSAYRAPAVRKIAPTSLGPRTVADVKARIEQDVRDRAPPMLVAVSAFNRPFHALGARMCRWPVSLDTREAADINTLFCGAPTPDGQSYCDACRPLGWQTRPQTKYGAAYVRSTIRGVA